MDTELKGDSQEGLISEANNQLSQLSGRAEELNVDIGRDCEKISNFLGGRLNYLVLRLPKGEQSLENTFLNKLALRVEGWVKPDSIIIPDRSVDSEGGQKNGSLLSITQETVFDNVSLRHILYPNGTYSMRLQRKV